MDTHVNLFHVKFIFLEGAIIKLVQMYAAVGYELFPPHHKYSDF